MNFLQSFLKIGFELAKTMVPAIATVEVAIKEIKAGGKKKDAVIQIIRSSPEIYEMIRNKEIIDEKMFGEGLSMINDGYVKIMNSVKKPAAEPVPVQ